MSRQELLEFDWFQFTSTAPAEVYQPDYVSIMHKIPQDARSNQIRMLKQLSTTCLSCSMCSLGLQPALNNNELRDPHVFSNLTPSPYMVVIDNPNWEDVVSRTPLSKDGHFNSILREFGLSRADFYIASMVRCHSTTDVAESVKRCSPFLEMELNLLEPELIIAAGPHAFSYLCPDRNYTESQGTITKNGDRKILAIDIRHTSHLRLVCKLILALRQKR